MTTARPWTVLGPGPLEKLDDNLWAVEDDVPGVPQLRRRMTIVRRSDGKLLFFNAVPVPDDTLAAIRALGTPAQLLIPSPFHSLDAAAFAAKLEVKAYGPPRSLAAVRERLEAAPYDELPADPAFEVQTVDGFKTGEGLLVVRSGPRASIVVSDLILNQRPGKGVTGLLFKLMGFTGDGPRLPKPVQLRVLRDRAAVKALFARLAATEGLARVVPSHGLVIDEDPAGVLRRLGESL